MGVEATSEEVTKGFCREILHGKHSGRPSSPGQGWGHHVGLSLGVYARLGIKDKIVRSVDEISIEQPEEAVEGGKEKAHGGLPEQRNGDRCSLLRGCRYYTDLTCTPKTWLCQACQYCQGRQILLELSKLRNFIKT